MSEGWKVLWEGDDEIGENLARLSSGLAKTHS